MGKINVAEVKKFNKEAKDQAEAVRTVAALIFNNISAFTSMNSFKGAGATAVKNYLLSEKVTYLTNLVQLTKDYSDKLAHVYSDFQTTVSEQSETAVIVTDDLVDFKKVVEDTDKTIGQTISDINTTLSSVNDLVTISQISDDTIHTDLTFTKNSIQETYENYVKWSNSNKDTLSNLATQFDALQKSAVIMHSMASDGVSGYTGKRMKSLRTNLSKLKSTSAYDVDAAKKLEKALKAKTTIEIEQATGISQPQGMSDAKYRQIIAASQTAANAIKGLSDDERKRVAQYYFYLLQSEKTKDWDATINSGLASLSFSVAAGGVSNPITTVLELVAGTASFVGERINKSAVTVPKLNEQELLQMAMLQEKYGDYGDFRMVSNTEKIGGIVKVSGDLAGKSLTAYSFYTSYEENYEEYGKSGRAFVYAGGVTAVGSLAELGATTYVSGIAAGALEAGGAAAVTAGAAVVVVPVIAGTVASLVFVYFYNNNDAFKDAVNTTGDTLEKAGDNVVRYQQQLAKTTYGGVIQ